MSRFLRSDLSGLQAYTPGEQPRDRRYIKLNTNESPFPPSEAVLSCLSREKMADLRLYSDPTCLSLREALAELWDVDKSNVLLSNGSDEMLNLSFFAYASREAGIAFPEISYSFYPVYAELHQVSAVQVPLRSDFRIALEDYAALDCPLLIANPNAPTGLALSRSELRALVAAKPERLIIIDEAYVDFGAESCLPLIREFDNLLIIGTFSKSRNLAGARIGYAVGAPSLIEDLDKIRCSTNPYNLSRMALEIGLAAVATQDYYKDCCRKVSLERERSTHELKSLGFEVLPSGANFVFARHPSYDAATLYRDLKSRGILVRYFSNPLISDFLRISIGLPEEMDLLIETCRVLLQR